MLGSSSSRSPRCPSTGYLSPFQSTELGVGLSVSWAEPPEQAASLLHPSCSLVLRNAKMGRLFWDEHVGFVAAQPSEVVPNRSSSPLSQDHCYYHGHVQGYGGSWVVLSTCSGIRYGEVWGGGLLGLVMGRWIWLPPSSLQGPPQSSPDGPASPALGAAWG